MSPRQLLRTALNRLAQAEAYVQKLPNYEVAAAYAIIKMREAKLELEKDLDPLLVRCGDKEPLSEAEEVVYDNLNGSLKIGKADFSILTDEQKFSAARVIVHQGYRLKGAAIQENYLGLRFEHIFIGIEHDGYAHS